jgi:hypothetical protein
MIDAPTVFVIMSVQEKSQAGNAWTPMRVVLGLTSWELSISFVRTIG